MKRRPSGANHDGSTCGRSYNSYSKAGFIQRLSGLSVIDVHELRDVHKSREITR